MLKSIAPRSVFLALACMACATAFAMADTPEANPRKLEDTVSEVEINAQREKLSVIRAEMVKLEDRFYARYNEINTDDQYDVSCGMSVPTGTNLKFRECQPVFVNRATEAEAQAFLRGDSPTLASMVIVRKWPDFEKTMQNSIDKAPELRKLIREREALEKRYKAVRKQKFKGKIIVID